MPLSITEYDTSKLFFVAAHNKDNLYITYYNFVHAHILSDPINIDNHRTTFRINKKHSTKKIYFKPTSSEAHSKYIENKNNLDNNINDPTNKPWNIKYKFWFNGNFKQIDQVDPIKQIDQVDPIKQIDQVDPIKQIDQVDPIKQIDQVDPIKQIDQVDPIKQIDQVDPIKQIDPINEEYINNYNKFISFMNKIKLILKDDFVKKHVTGKNPDTTTSCDIVLTVKTNKLNNINGAITNGGIKYSISLDELKYILRSNVVCRLEVCPEYFYIGKRKKDGSENFRLGVTFKSLHIENDQLSKLPKRVEIMIKYTDNKDKINDIKQLDDLYNNKIIPRYMSKKSIVSNILNSAKNI